MPAKKIWSLNYRLLMSVLSAVAPDITELGLEAKELFLLAEVEACILTRRNLAGVLSMPKPTVTTYVKRLEAAGFRAPRDRWRGFAPSPARVDSGRTQNDVPRTCTLVEGLRCADGAAGYRTAVGTRVAIGAAHLRDQEIRSAPERHWRASDCGDLETEHDIYLEEAVLEYPQSAERIRGRRNIQLSRANQPNKKRFVVRRIMGGADLCDHGICS